MSGAQDKTCVICGQDCAGLPRIKNDKGQYAHKACVAKKQSPEPHPEPDLEADPYALDGDAGLAMDDLLGDLDPTEDAPGIRAACPSCGSALTEGAVVCMGCGHNTQTGKTLTSKVITPKDPGAATAVAAQAGGIAAVPVLWIIGGVIGGAVGATIWAAISYFTNFEIGFIAVLVGFLTGVGVHVASMGRGAGFFAGVVAAAIAVASIGAGKYASVHFAVQDLLAESTSMSMATEDIEDEWLFTTFADEDAQRRLDEGETIDWPNPEMIARVAQWPDDYPENVRVQTLAALDAMSDDQLERYRQRLAAEYTKEWDEPVRPDEIDEDWLIDELAMDTAQRLAAEGEPLDWPDTSLAISAALWPDDYPQGIRDAAQSRFDAMSTSELDTVRADIAYERKQAMEEFTTLMSSSITEAGFRGSFNLFDILWIFLAIGAAFSVASGEGFNLTGD